MVAEDIVCKIADYLGKNPEEVRQINFLKVGDRLPFGTDDKQILSDEHILKDVYAKADNSFKLKERRERIQKYNESSKWKKRGVAVVPTMFGIAFGLKCLNQGGALVHIYTDGSVLVNHGGIEMGQGRFLKFLSQSTRLKWSPKIT